MAESVFSVYFREEEQKHYLHEPHLKEPPPPNLRGQEAIWMTLENKINVNDYETMVNEASLGTFSGHPLRESWDKLGLSCTKLRLSLAFLS